MMREPAKIYFYSLKAPKKFQNKYFNKEFENINLIFFQRMVENKEKIENQKNSRILPYYQI